MERPYEEKRLVFRVCGRGPLAARQAEASTNVSRPEELGVPFSQIAFAGRA